MDILMIGGTRFVGRHIVEAALARGHKLTLFHRGKTGADIFPDVETIQGDRDNQADLDQLRGRAWDTVIDTCAYIPRHVRMITQTLRDTVPHYTLISTISVYEDPVAYGADENAPLKSLDDETTEQVTNETYGGLKVLCEIDGEMSGVKQFLNIRPGLVVGPHDPTDRFTYWVERVARGGEMLVPGDLSRTVQYIDGRDMAAFIVGLVEQRATGTFNAVNPSVPTTWGDWLGAMREAFGSDAQFTVVSDDFLIAQGANGGELPFWVPPPDEGVLGMSNRKAIDAGLTSRSTGEIARDTLAWSQSRGADYTLKVGLSPAREAELLTAWKTQS